MKLCMVQDAVVLALSFDMALASATANRPEEEPALKRSLWLTIARHIVHQHPSQDQARLHVLLTHHCMNAAIATACLLCTLAPGYSCRMSAFLLLSLPMPFSWLSSLLILQLSLPWHMQYGLQCLSAWQVTPDQVHPLSVKYTYHCFPAWLQQLGYLMPPSDFVSSLSESMPMTPLVKNSSVTCFSIGRAVLYCLTALLLLDIARHSVLPGVADIVLHSMLPCVADTAQNSMLTLCC